ncbi:hypothetical protein B7P43_G14851 [Cryptotermes secundus]|uniref:Uncharacterized protein n=1 Tax=Cryptotermes secundus TaxID=105785 RepID=A0A2J7QD16_9NEOP|nr:uncharacterized protein LOC111868319 isoform X2 [Cryptotermes secundus]PNF26474.1 hypothetical protein B7P43_G14851 [Cryptotermes secundus]
MSSPCNHRIIKLRERNRILLDQLESNSILLKRRLKKLKRTARAARYSEKPWQDLPVSPLKRKYESWKARNYSGQVAAAVNATAHTLSSSSSNSQELNVKYKQKVEDITSPAKRSKQNVQIESRARIKEVLPCECCKCHLKSSTAIDVRNSGKEYEDCYCKRDAGRDRTNSDISSQESEGSISALHIGSKIHEEPVELHSVKYNMNTGITENQQRRTLEAAHVIIDYSPKSMFLKKLKERSQVVGDFIAPENIRTPAKLSSVTPPKKSSYSDKSTVGTKLMKPTKVGSVKTNLKKSSPLKTPHSSRLPSDHDGHGLISDHNQQGTTKRSPCRSLRRSCNDELRLRKNRKRVCYRKNCHCHVKEDIRSTENFPSIVKEKEVKLANEGLANPRTSSSPCKCCCDCSTQQIHTPKTPLIMSNVGAGLVESEHDKKHIQPQCCGRGSWFDEMNEFRQSHWFDCHAYPHPAGTSRDATRNLDVGSIHPNSHKCVHKYVLDDRMFARPLYSDHLNNSRCVVCHLPYNLSKSKTRETPPVTLPSTLQDPEIQVSIPLGSPHGRRPSASGNVLSHKKVTQPSGRSRSASSPRSRSQPSIFKHTLGDLKPRAPPPADSLALRYQKGVAK